MEDGELWDRYEADRNIARRNALVDHHRPLVKAVAHNLAQSLTLSPDLGFDDLVGYGYIGLIEAVEAFDRGRGVQFSTFASCRIRGAILDAIRSLDWVPRNERDRERAGEASPPVVSALDDGDSFIGPSDDPGAAEERREFWREKLAHLDAEERTVIEGIYVNCQHTRELAEEMGRPRLRIEEIKRRAIRKLQGEPTLPSAA